MKKIFSILFIVLSAICANAQWQTNGPDSTTIQCLAVSDTTIFAGTAHKGIFISNDKGGSWATANTGLPYTNFTYVSSMLVSGSNIFASTVGGGVFLSNNNGGSWSTVNNGLGNNVFSLGINGSTIFAGTDGGVFISSDNGSNWTAANTGLTGNVGSFTAKGGNVFAGTDSGVYISNNNGGSWAATANSQIYGAPVYSLAYNDSILYAGTLSGGTFYSVNNGGTWIQMNLNQPIDGYISSIVFFNDTNVFAGDFGAGVSLITTPQLLIGYNGNGWASVGTGLINNGVSSLVVSGGYIFAGTGGSGVWQLPLYTVIIDGIPEMPGQAKGDFSLYPNPANGSFIVQTSTNTPQLLQVCDITGQVVFSQAIENSKTTVDVSALAAGMYIVSLKSNNSVTTQKLVIAK